jgi:putative ABC transport system substrate-binding protein
MPVVGFLDSRPPDAMADRLRGFSQGLKDTGYVERDNLAIEYRWADKGCRSWRPNWFAARSR